MPVILKLFTKFGKGVILQIKIDHGCNMNNKQRQIKVFVRYLPNVKTRAYSIINFYQIFV